MASTVVYTAIFHNYDKLLEVPKQHIEKDTDYICFTDSPTISSRTYRIIRSDLHGQCPSRANRDFKINVMQHLSSYSQSIYLDGNQAICNKLSKLFEYLHLHNGFMAAFQHSRNTCTYSESQDVLNRKQDQRAVVESQMAHYHAEGFPRNFGLTWNGLLVRLHTPETHKLCSLWHDELQMFSFRDQLSLMYVIWKNQIDFCVIGDDSKKSLRSQFVRAQPHSKTASTPR